MVLDKLQWRGTSRYTKLGSERRAMVNGREDGLSRTHNGKVGPSYIHNGEAGTGGAVWSHPDAHASG
jgi:hypothetical protein